MNYGVSKARTALKKVIARKEAGKQSGGVGAAKKELAAVKAAKYKTKLDRRRESSSEKQTAKRTEAAERVNRYIKTQEGNKIRLSADGYIGAESIKKHSLRVKDANKLNDIIDEKGKHIVGVNRSGNQRQQTGKEKVRFDARFDDIRDRVAVFGKGSSDSDRKKGDSSGRSSSGSSGGNYYNQKVTGNFRARDRVERMEPKGPDFYNTADSMPKNPNFSPTGSPNTSGPGNSGNSPTYWDRTAENLLSYSDRLGGHNRDMRQWIGGIGATSRRESDAYLGRLAGSLPPAPDPRESDNDVLDFLRRSNKVLNSTRNTD
jgi:hypothetical protein